MKNRDLPDLLCESLALCQVRSPPSSELSPTTQPAPKVGQDLPPRACEPAGDESVLCSGHIRDRTPAPSHSAPNGSVRTFGTLGDNGVSVSELIKSAHFMLGWVCNLRRVIRSLIVL